jgi:hypothetical protein
VSSSFLVSSGPYQVADIAMARVRLGMHWPNRVSQCGIPWDSFFRYVGVESSKITAVSPRICLVLVLLPRCMLRVTGMDRQEVVLWRV